MDDQAYLERVYGDVGGVSVKLFLGVLLVVTLAYNTIIDPVSISEQSRTPHAALPPPPHQREASVARRREKRGRGCVEPHRRRA